MTLAMKSSLLDTAARRARVLLITPDAPGHSGSGTQQRSHRLYEALRKSSEVDVIVLQGANNTSVEKAAEPDVLGILRYAAGGGSLATVRLDAELSRWADQNVNWPQYAVVVARHMPSLTKIRLPQSLPAILDLDDAIRRFGAPRSGMPLCVADRVKSVLRTIAYKRLLRRASHVFFCSELDRRAYPGVSSSVLPNVTVLPAAESIHSSGESRTILFVGALWYGPNRDGVEWMLKRVWPRVRARCPDATLRLVGAASNDVLSSLSSHQGVEVPGFVDDLAAEYRSAAFTVAPIWYGGGTNIKILESLAHARAAVVTELAYRPLQTDLMPGRSVVVAGDEETMAAKCVELLTLDTLRDAIGAEGRRAVAARFSGERFEQEVARVLGTVLGSQAPGSPSLLARERADLDA